MRTFLIRLRFYSVKVDSLLVIHKFSKNWVYVNHESLISRLFVLLLGLPYRSPFMLASNADHMPTPFPVILKLIPLSDKKCQAKIVTVYFFDTACIIYNDEVITLNRLIRSYPWLTRSLVVWGVNRVDWTMAKCLILLEIVVVCRIYARWGVGWGVGLLWSAVAVA